VIVDGYQVEPLTLDRFDDFVTVLGRGGISGCWCMYWTCPTSAAWGEGCKGGSEAPNRQAFRDLVEVGPPPGLLAYDAGEPVAWCRIMARDRLPGLANSRYFKTELDIEGVWSLPCFVVRRSHRGKGLTATLITAALEFVADRGGSIVEGYPWDTDDVKSPAVVYTGLASTFERLGFDVVQRRAGHKPMMRIAVGPATR
jgi:GNAT superfamily N-acetyltransferase